MARLVAAQLASPALVARWQAHRRAGEAVAPLDPALPERARAALLERLRPHALVDGDGERGLVGPNPVDDDVELVVATSGASGLPKAVELTRAALDAAAQASLARLGAQGWRWLCPLPLHHVAGLQVVRRAWLGGTEPVVHEGFDVAAVAAAEVDATALVPTQLRRLVDAGTDLAHLQAVLLGGAAADAALLAAARDAGVPVVVTYGMTETCGGCVYDGRPLDGVEVAVADDGHVCVRGPVLARRYRGDPRATAEAFADGWFRSADRGRWARDGRLEILGRSDDVIVTGGENVSSEAVRRALEDDPSVAEAAVVGLPDPEWGDRVAAVVVPADPAWTPSLDMLRDRVAERLGKPAAPAVIRLAATVPRTALGKIDAAAVARWLAEGWCPPA